MKRKYLYSVFIILILIRGLLLFLNVNYGLYLKGNNTELVLNFIIIVAGFASFTKASDWIRAFVYSFCIILIIASLYSVYNNFDSVQLYYTSPKRSNTLIIKQIYHWDSHHTELYQQKYTIFKRKIPREDISGFRWSGIKDMDVNWLNENEVRIYHSVLNGEAEMNIKLNN